MTTSVAPDRATSTSRPLAEADPEVAALVAAERDRQARKIRLIPSENYSSLAVRQTLASVFANKYAEGYPGRRYYEGQQNVDRVETLAIERARAVFGYDHANVQPYAGSGANLAVYAAFCEPGDTVMGMALPMGGHLTHGHGVSVTGKWFTSVQYGVRRETGLIDMDQVRDLAREHRPKVIFCGGTAIPRTIDFAAFAEVAREVDAVLVADMAHISGLIAGGAHPSPLGHATVMTTSTHKALRGPRGGMVACDEAHAKAVDRAVFPGLQGGPHEHVIAALAVALREAGGDAFAAYAHAVVENARALGEALAERGHDLVSGGTDNHLLLVDFTATGVPGKAVAQALDRAGLVANYNTVPYDTRKPFDPSGLRLGTPAVTTRGMGTEEMRAVAGWIDDVVQAVKAGSGDADEAVLDRVAKEAGELSAAFPPPADALGPLPGDDADD